jgi:hypothetical protein
LPELAALMMANVTPRAEPVRERARGVGVGLGSSSKYKVYTLGTFSGVATGW